jgi:hypothetical protein
VRAAWLPLIALVACNQFLGVDQDYTVGDIGAGASTGSMSSVGGGSTSAAGGSTSTATGGGSTTGAGGMGATTSSSGSGGTPMPTPVFSESFDTGDWPVGNWLTEKLGSNSAVEVSNNEGRLHFGTASPAWARATSLAAALADAEVVLKFHFNLPDTEGNFWIWLRASGSFGATSLPDTAYGVRVNNSSGDLALERTVGGARLALANGSWSGAPDAGDYQLRFQVFGNQIRVRVWPDGNAEPAVWTLEATDDMIAGAGDFRLAYIKVSSARWVYVDDIELSSL